MADVIIDVPAVPDVVIEVEERVFRQVRWGWRRFRCILNTNPQDKEGGLLLGKLLKFRACGPKRLPGRS